MMWGLVATWVFCPIEASRGMIRLASPVFFPALLPSDSRVGWGGPPPSSRRGVISGISPNPGTGSWMGSGLGLQQLVQGILSPQWLVQWVHSAWYSGLLFTGEEVTSPPFMKGLFLATACNYAGSLRTKPVQSWENSKTLFKPRGDWSPTYHLDFSITHANQCPFYLNQLELDVLMF